MTRHALILVLLAELGYFLAAEPAPEPPPAAPGIPAALDANLDPNPGAHPRGQIQDLPYGSFQVRPASGTASSTFVLERTEYEAEVSGAFASVEVTQTFANPHKERVEAVYTFPLPEHAAVNRMTMRVGQRVIMAEIREREEAKKVYEAAKSSGQAAALLEQERPNIFTQSVANILPGEKILVRLRYLHEVRYDDGRYQLVIPLVVGPRYMPGQAKPGPDAGHGWSANTEAVADAGRISPFPLLPGERSGHEVSIRVNLKPGLTLKSLRSTSHQLHVKRASHKTAEVSLAPLDTIPNKDFILEYSLQGRRPEIALLSHAKAGEGTLMLLLQPQAKPRPQDVTPKEMVFVVDTSGSMDGEPIAKVKQAMRRALRGMNARDTFQIIRFDMSASALSPKPLDSSPENVRRGLSTIDSLHGAGGTEMLTGIKAALDFPRDPRRRRIVFFMTDGYIGNEAQILAAIAERLGETRLFSFGVGSSVNRALLDSMATVGRGFVQYVRNDEDPAAAVERFYRRIRNPLLLDLAIDWGGLQVQEVVPAVIPDLFDAQPLFVFARYSGASTGTVQIKGQLAGTPYVRNLYASLRADQPEHSVLPPLWARKTIDELTATQNAGEISEIASRIKDLALRHNLASKYTSFVAVERRLRPGLDIPLRTVLVPVEMPEGVSFETHFLPGSAAVSIPRMKPGDPVLSVDAPPGTIAVIADLPMGERRLCRWDADSERWQCRFLVPRGVPEGRHPIKITCVGRDSSRTVITAFYTVDSKAPILDVRLRRTAEGIEVLALPRRNVLEPSRCRDGRARLVHDVKRLRLRTGDGAITLLKLQDKPGVFEWRGLAPASAAGPWIMEAVDFAGNVHRQNLRVLP